MSEPGRADWRAFGTGAVLCTTDPGRLDAAREAVESVLARIDRTCNRFDPTSELAQVNAVAGRRVRVSDTLARAISTALDAAQATDGAVDPTVGASLESAGYDRDFDTIEPDGPVARYTPAGGWRRVSFDADELAVAVPRGVKLDLGSTGKALAVDLAAAAAHNSAGCGVLFSLGGDIAVRGEAPAGGWLVHVTDDHAADSSAPGQTIALAEGGLATSSTLVRRWQRGDHVHHILDPATGAPAREVWCTVSVAARSCVEANTHATAAIVRGEHADERLAASGLPARLRSRDGVVKHVANWPTAGETACGPGI